MRTEHLADRHDVAGFTCGVKAMDDCLARHGLENERRGLSRTYVLLDDGDAVAGYYTLTVGGVMREVLPNAYGRGLPPFEIGMVLLARLAVAQDRQGSGLGRDLLIDAIDQALRVSERSAAPFIAVDPIDEQARAFYEHFGFRSIAGDEAGRMFLRVDHAKAALGRD